MKEMNPIYLILSVIFFGGSLLALIGYIPVHPLEVNFLFFFLWLIAVMYYYKVNGPLG